jgi:hypothetical protein
VQRLASLKPQKARWREARWLRTRRSVGIFRRRLHFALIVASHDGAVASVSVFPNAHNSIHAMHRHPSLPRPTSPRLHLTAAKSYGSLRCGRAQQRHALFHHTLYGDSTLQCGQTERYADAAGKCESRHRGTGPTRAVNIDPGVACLRVLPTRLTDELVSTAQHSKRLLRAIL